MSNFGYEEQRQTFNTALREFFHEPTQWREGLAALGVFFPEGCLQAENDHWGLKLIARFGDHRDEFLAKEPKEVFLWCNQVAQFMPLQVPDLRYAVYSSSEGFEPTFASWTVNVLPMMKWRMCAFAGLHQLERTLRSKSKFWDSPELSYWSIQPDYLRLRVPSDPYTYKVGFIRMSDGSIDWTAEVEQVSESLRRFKTLLPAMFYVESLTTRP